MTDRKLALRREVVTELSDADLRAVAAGEGTTDTWFSCLTFISCNPLQCLISEHGHICLEK